MSQLRDFSFEFFPPKSDEGRAKLLQTAQRLARLRPQYFSVTFGAGGSTRDNTLATVQMLLEQTGIETVPHISGIGSSRAQIDELLALYQRLGVRRLVVLRGDMPSGMRDLGDFRYAIDLVRYIRASTGEQFRIEVAAYPEYHPQAASAHSDRQHFAAKMAAGADSAITQYFYNADAYFDFVERVRQLGVSQPIVPGIMPITNYRNIQRFSDMCGAEIPRWLRKQFELIQDDPEATAQFGQRVVLQLCQRLLAGGVHSLHFYSMNSADAVLPLCEALGIESA